MFLLVFSFFPFFHFSSQIDLFHYCQQDNKDVLKLIVGKHNLTSPISSYSRPEVLVKSQSYYFTHSVKTMAVTATAKGITSKQILVGTIGDQVCQMSELLDLVIARFDFQTNL